MLNKEFVAVFRKVHTSERLAETVLTKITVFLELLVFNKQFKFIYLGCANPKKGFNAISLPFCFLILSENTLALLCGFNAETI